MNISHFECDTWLPSQQSLPQSRIDDGKECVRFDGTGILIFRFHVICKGICDCCDGSDEAVGVCSNTCLGALEEAKRAALVHYRKIQSGARVRKERADAARAVRVKLDRRFQQLKLQRRDLKSMIATITYWLALEEVRERSLRFKLLRDREIRCANGEVETACDHVDEVTGKHVGMYDSFFHNDKELMKEGVRGNYKNEKRRLILEHSQDEVDHLKGLSGVEKVKAELCLIKELLPDDSVRVHGTLGEFLSFASSPLGETRRRKNPTEMRRAALFGEFLEADDAEEGAILFAAALCEYIGLALSPITMSMRAAFALADYAHSAAAQWSRRVLTETQQQQQQQQQQQHGDHHDAVVAVARAVNMLLDVNATDSLMKNPMYANVFNALDPLQYPAIVALMDRVQSITRPMQWALSVMWQSPMIYYDFLFGSWHLQLPPRRSCCLLRQGLETAMAELREADALVAEERVKHRDEGAEEEFDLDDPVAIGSASEIMSNAYKRIEFYIRRLLFIEKPSSGIAMYSTMTRSGRGKEAQLGTEHIGMDKEWEALVDVCVAKHIGQYKYSVCFFDSIRQNEILIGQYERWQTPIDSASADQLVQMYGNGTVCFGANERSARVEFQCGAENAIMDVIEREVCDG